MAITLAQASAGTSQTATTSRVQTLTGVLVGSLVVVKVGLYNMVEGDYTVVTDRGETALLAVSKTTAGTHALSSIWYFYAVNAGTHVITVASTVGSRDIAMEALEFPGPDSGVAPLTNSGTGTSTTPKAGSVTSVVDGSLFVFCGVYEGSSTTQTPDAGFTKTYSYEGDVHMPIFCAYQIQGTAGGLDAGLTLGASRQWFACVAVFRPTGGGGGSALLRQIQHNGLFVGSL